MSDLSMNLSALETLSTRLTSVSNDLSSSEAFSRTVAGLVGDDRLAQVVRDFAEKWNIRREHLITEIEGTAAAATAIHDTFEELDKKLASSAGTFSTSAVEK